VPPAALLLALTRAGLLDLRALEDGDGGAEPLGAGAAPGATQSLLRVLHAALLSGDCALRGCAAAAAAALARAGPARGCAIALEADLAEHLFALLRTSADDAEPSSAAACAADAARRDATSALRHLAAAAPAAFRRRFAFGAAAVTARLTATRAAGDVRAAAALARLAQRGLEADARTLPRGAALALAAALAEALSALSPEVADPSAAHAAERGQALSPPHAALAAAACDALAALCTWLPFGDDAAAVLRAATRHAAAALRHADGAALFAPPPLARLHALQLGGAAHALTDAEADAAHDAAAFGDEAAGGSLFAAACTLLQAWGGCCARGAATAPAAAAAAADEALAATDEHIVPIGLAAIEEGAADEAAAGALLALLAAALRDDASASPPASRGAAAAKLAAHGGIAAAFAATAAAPAARPAAAEFMAALLLAHPAPHLRALLRDVAQDVPSVATLLSLLPPRLADALALLAERPPPVAMGATDAGVVGSAAPAAAQLAAAQRGLIVLLCATVPDDAADADGSTAAVVTPCGALPGAVLSALDAWCARNGAALAASATWSHALVTLWAACHGSICAGFDARDVDGDDAMRCASLPPLPSGGEAVLRAAAAVSEPDCAPGSTAARWLLQRDGGGWDEHAAAEHAARMLRRWLLAHGDAWPPLVAASDDSVAMPPLLRLLCNCESAAAALQRLVCGITALEEEETVVLLRALEASCTLLRGGLCLLHSAVPTRTHTSDYARVWCAGVRRARFARAGCRALAIRRR
jgi:hypothetical protein